MTGEEAIRMLWVLARKDSNCLMIQKADLDSVPEGAELMSWYEPLYDAWVLKGICTPIKQPEGSPIVSQPARDPGPHQK